MLENHKKKGPKIFLLDKIRDNFFETLDRQTKRRQTYGDNKLIILNTSGLIILLLIDQQN